MTHTRTVLTPARRLFAVLSTALLAVVVTAVPAAAKEAPAVLPGSAWLHTSLESSEPAADSVLTEPPATITLTFTEAVQNTDTEVTVTGPGAEVYPTTPEVTGADVRAALSPLAGSGTFVISYRVTAADGDAISGELAFVVQLPVPSTSAVAATSELIETPVPTTAPAVTIGSTGASTASGSAGTEPSGPVTTDGQLTATTTAAADGDSGSTGWVWAIVAVVLIGAVVAVLLIRRRRTDGAARQR